MEPLKQNTNVPEYHNVIAHSLAVINGLIADKRYNEAQKILEYQITYAYTLWKVEINKASSTDDIEREIKALKLDKKDIMELVISMVYYQSKAGIKPVQITDNTAQTFERFKHRS